VHQFLLAGVRDWLTLDAANRVEMLRAYIKQQQERVALVASRTQLRHLLQQYLEGTLSPEPFQEQSRRILNDARKSTEGYLAIWITNPQGQVITSTHAEYLHRDYAHDPAFISGQQDKTLGIPQPHEKGYQALLTAPAFADNGRELGVVMVLLDVEPMRRFLSIISGDHATDEVLVVANNGKEALQAYAAASFDLILMDVQMPEMDGLEATAAIRAKEKGSGTHVPIFAMTAEAMVGDGERCLAAGMDGYLSKPVRATDLYRVVEEMLPRQTVSPSASSPSAVAMAVTATRGDVDSTPPLDWQEALEQLDGNTALLQNLVAVFREECPKLMAGIQDAMTREDTSALRRAAHTLKSSANVFAAKPVAAAAWRLETLGRAGTLAGAAEAWAALETAVAQLLPALDRFAHQYTRSRLSGYYSSAAERQLPGTGNGKPQ
jgi:CheY-like chemotaxis protein